MHLELRQGDITAQPDIDALVNAANTDLTLGAGVAGAFARRAGPAIEEEARRLGPISLGEAVATSAGALPNKYIIHAAAMGYRPEDQQVPKREGSLSSAAIIYAATSNALKRADELGCRSIAFPALATGVARFPVDECAEVMIRAVQDFERQHPESSVGRVILVLHSTTDFAVFHQKLET